MTATAHESNDPQILDIWDDYLRASDRYDASMRAEQDRLGRSIYRSTGGFSRREQVVGLQSTSGPPPQGWTKLAKNDFLTPSRGKLGQPERDWLSEHQPPRSIGQLLAEFGVEEMHVTAGRVYWPGLERLAGGLYVTWGVDTGWDGGEHFDPVPLSAYYAVEEAVDAASISARLGTIVVDGYFVKVAIDLYRGEGADYGYGLPNRRSQPRKHGHHRREQARHRGQRPLRHQVLRRRRPGHRVWDGDRQPGRHHLHGRGVRTYGGAASVGWPGFWALNARSRSTGRTFFQVPASSCCSLGRFSGPSGAGGIEPFSKSSKLDVGPKVRTCASVAPPASASSPAAAPVPPPVVRFVGFHGKASSVRRPT